MLKMPFASTIIDVTRHAVLASSVALPYLRALIQYNIKDFPSLLKYSFKALDSSLLNWSIYLVQLGRQFQEINLYSGYCLSLANNFPFYGPITQEIFDCVRNHPKRILLIWGTGDLMHSCRQTEIYKKQIPQIRVCKRKS